MIPKFRAWDKHGQKMFSGTELIIWNNNVYANDGKELSCDYLKGWSIDEEYLMQSTGLLDRNRKEIFEGDIITNGEAVVDVKNHPTLGFYTVVNDVERFFGSNTSIKDFENDVEEFSSVTEIIGNIYENPELLEVKE